MVLLFLFACNEAGVRAYNTPPVTSIVSPEDAAQVEPGAVVEFYGIARDEQDLAPELAVRWESSLDGVLDTSSADANGDLRISTNTLSPGSHIITLSAQDTEGQSGESTITLQVGAGDNSPGSPVIVILSPAEGSQVGSSAVVNLLATVADDADPPQSLVVEVLDVPDGVIWNGYPAATSTLDVPMDPSIGLHTVVVSALDSTGKSGTASVSFEVIQDNVPVVNINTPTTGSTYDNIDTITFSGTISDDTTPPELVATVWSSDLQGLLSANPPDSYGTTSFGSALMVGTHIITLTATDQEGDEGRDTVALTIEDPLDRDDDGDGYTENAGDCDDTDDTLSPAETDVCNDVDEDCDGYVNDPYWDSYEYNQTSALAYSFGEVDKDFLWSGSTLEISGLTFSDANDDDWFYWEADDELWDNVDVSVIVSNLNASGDYVVELYDEGLNLLGSDMGDGSISVEWTSDIWDDGDDGFYVHVYAVSWPSASCSNSYKLQLRS